MEETLKLYHDLFEKPKLKKVASNICCDQEMIIDDCYRICTKCGNALDEFVYVIQTKSIHSKKRVIYKRIGYFKHLLYLYSCNKLSSNPNYDKTLVILKKEQFDTIADLRYIMKKKKMNKLYPAIYLLYYDIKKIKLIPLTRNEIENMIYIFIKIEREFKKNKNGRKNIYSYNLLINRLLKHFKYIFYDQVPIPVSNYKMVKQIDNILYSLNIQ